MRRDASDDFDDHLPSLSASDRDEEDFEVPAKLRDRTTVYSRTTPVVKVKAPWIGALWAVVGALSIALIGLGAWSFQHISMMQQQLVATQESFARISEDAAGRLQAISGKVANSESSSNSDTEALKLAFTQFQDKFDAQMRQQQSAAGEQSGLGKRLDDAFSQAKSQQAAQQSANEQLQGQLKTLETDLASLKAAQGNQSKVDTQLSNLDSDVTALKKQGNPGPRLDQLEQDMIVVKSQLDNQSAAAQGGPDTAEFDSFRRQTTRNLTTLQSQMQNLQQQLNAKH